jgi:hypothetical protein
MPRAAGVLSGGDHVAADAAKPTRGSVPVEVRPGDLVVEAQSGETAVQRLAVQISGIHRFSGAPEVDQAPLALRWVFGHPETLGGDGTLIREVR